MVAGIWCRRVLEKKHIDIVNVVDVSIGATSGGIGRMTKCRREFKECHNAVAPGGSVNAVVEVVSVAQIVQFTRRQLKAEDLEAVDIAEVFVKNIHIVR